MVDSSEALPIANHPAQVDDLVDRPEPSASWSKGMQLSISSWAPLLGTIFEGGRSQADPEGKHPRRRAVLHVVVMRFLGPCNAPDLLSFLGKRSFWTRTMMRLWWFRPPNWLSHRRQQRRRRLEALLRGGTFGGYFLAAGSGK